MRVGRAVFQHQLHGQRLLRYTLVAARLDVAAQAQQLGRGLREVHVHRVQLNDGGQHAGLVGGDQRARRY